MSFTEPRAWLISYDIADPARLRRVHAFLKSHAVPVQYSVFLARLSQRRLAWLLGELGRLIAHDEDDVRAYPIPADCEVVTLGRQYLPQGLLLADPLLGAFLSKVSPLQEPVPQCDKEDTGHQEEP